MRTIFLIGFMGAGKSSVGKRLSTLLQLPFYDSDEEIITEQKMDINTIFAKHGEHYFRDLETNMLKKLSQQGGVISTGGGMIGRTENRRLLRESGKVIFLFAQPEELMKRLEKDESRPLIAGDKRKSMGELYEKRMRFYEETAHLIIDTSNRDIESVAQEMLTRLKTL